MALPDNGSSPRIALYSSPDMKHYKFESWLVKSAALPEDCPTKHRFWAPGNRTRLRSSSSLPR
jgi:xylan 1,4-beta-xylosidase